MWAPDGASHIYRDLGTVWQPVPTSCLLLLTADCENLFRLSCSGLMQYLYGDSCEQIAEITSLSGIAPCGEGKADAGQRAVSRAHGIHRVMYADARQCPKAALIDDHHPSVSAGHKYRLTGPGKQLAGG